MRGYPQFSFWTLIALAKICFFHIFINRAKILLYLWANSFRNPNTPRCAEGGTVLKLQPCARLFLVCDFKSPSPLLGYVCSQLSSPDSDWKGRRVGRSQDLLNVARIFLGWKRHSARCERNFNIIVKHACVCCAPCHVQGNAKMNCSLVTRSAEPAAILIHVRRQRGSSITRRTSGLEQIQERPGKKIRSEESTGDERSPTFSLIVSQNLFLCLTLSNSWLFWRI